MALSRRLSAVLERYHSAEAFATFRCFSSKRTRGDIKSGEEEWNDAWEMAWLPDDLSSKAPRAPWESDVTFSLPSTDKVSLQSTPEGLDVETRAFVEDMNDNWEQRKGKSGNKDTDRNTDLSASSSSSSSLYCLENIKKDYRLTKQRVHAGLWVKEIEKLEEAKLGYSIPGVHDIEKFLDSASEIFDSSENDMGKGKSVPSELKNKPDGWETTSKSGDGSLWDMSQREEDILVQEFERRIAYNKFQIASFIKTHIFSRRRPIDGWKYMIEEIGPNSRRVKGSVTRSPSVSDEATQPFSEQKTPFLNPPR